MELNGEVCYMSDIYLLILVNAFVTMRIFIDKWPFVTSACQFIRPGFGELR